VFGGTSEAAPDKHIVDKPSLMPLIKSKMDKLHHKQYGAWLQETDRWSSFYRPGQITSPTFKWNISREIKIKKP
jgi:hypothetical protein